MGCIIPGFALWSLVLSFMNILCLPKKKKKKCLKQLVGEVKVIVTICGNQNSRIQ